MSGSIQHQAHPVHPTFNGYPRNNVSRRPPPYRDVPLCRKSASGSFRDDLTSDHGRIPVSNTRYQRAQSVPPRTTCNGNVSKPNRPKSLHQPFSYIPPESNVHLTVPPTFPHFTAFPQSVSLQFDTLSDSCHDRHPVPSPAPAERKHRHLRRANVGVEPDSKSRSSSVPRTHSFPRNTRMRPLSHPTSLASSLSSWSSSSLAFQMAGATPAPAPSPSSSTPSPSRPLGPNHAPHPHDALRTHHGIRLLEKKLELYVDILTSQERFVQVTHTICGSDHHYHLWWSFPTITVKLFMRNR